MSELATRCRETVTLLEKATGWVSDDRNAGLVGREKLSIQRNLRRAALRAQRLEKAVARPMCVGVFGPSQAGKSYLVEVLARPEGGALRARFDGQVPVDFLSEINPAGEKESTGLVTRFTARSTAGKSPEGFPVQLRMLTEPDVIKILGNTYFNDGDQTKESVPSPAAIADLLAGLTAQAASATPALKEDDVVDIQEYFLKNFSGARLVDVLSSFWERAREIAGRLDMHGRAKLFSVLWGDHPQFTALYRELVGAIEALGRPEEIFAPIAALIPRSGSILDVATLAGLGHPSDDMLEVRSLGGRSLKLSRPVLAALTAELRIELEDKPRPFFDDVDLLDFPGARSRQKVHLSAFFDANSDALKETFLRGKVAYLFDRYVAEQELTSMLLCVRPSNQEVATLPDLVDDWIASTHGRNPQSRIGRPTLLFFVLTWFDMHFVDKAGDTSAAAGGRFAARMEASLLSFFGKAHAWPRNWTPGKPFTNCFWFRNPNYPAESIIRYDRRREIEFLPEKAGRIAELREGFLSIPESSQHFRDPARAFDEALKLNDGGISYLAESVAAVCNPQLKIQQITDRLHELRQEVRGLVGKFYVDLDIERRLDERRAAANRAMDELEIVVQNNKFGSFLRQFHVDPSDLTDSVYAAIRGEGVKREGSSPATPVGTGAAPKKVVTRPKVVRPGSTAAVETVKSEPIAPQPVAAQPAGGERELFLSRTCIDAWVERITQKVDDDALLRHFGLSREVMKDLVDEKLALVRRLGLESSLAEELRQHVTLHVNEAASSKIALIAAKRLNSLMGDLGFSRMPASARPTVEDDSGKRLAFAGRTAANDLSRLTTEPVPFAERYASDWFHGFLKIVEENAVSTENVQVDLEMNGKLKAILAALDAGSEAQG